MLHWTIDEWRHATDTASTPAGLHLAFVDLPIDPSQTAPIRFTFLWPDEQRWEGRDYTVEVIGSSCHLA